MKARILPFAAYLVFLAGAQLVSGENEASPGSSSVALWLYPIKTAVVLGLLIYFWPEYTELRERWWRRSSDLVLALATGLVVYALWVRMDWPWAMQGDGPANGYDPFQAGVGVGWILAGIRLFGASVVVPIMEELFWRSFLMRYLISSKFDAVPLGAFTPLSFIVTVALFGVEHDLWLAGMMAGAAYAGVLYATKRLWPCILAHGVTNFALGVHVLLTGEWKWW
ncbi:CAAX prenyl protease-related protein [Candidatus Nitrospira bockiana]